MQRTATKDRHRTSSVRIRRGPVLVRRKQWRLKEGCGRPSGCGSTLGCRRRTQWSTRQRCCRRPWQGSRSQPGRGSSMSTSPASAFNPSHTFGQARSVQSTTLVQLRRPLQELSDFALAAFRYRHHPARTMPRGVKGRVHGSGTKVLRLSFCPACSHYSHTCRSIHVRRRSRSAQMPAEDGEGGQRAGSQEAVPYPSRIAWLAAWGPRADT